jgi:hypothetical protein
LTVVSGGWSLSAAERVCCGGGLEEIQVLDLMSSLASKSMIVVDPERVGETQYRSLETIREYSSSAGLDERSRDIFRYTTDGPLYLTYRIYKLVNGVPQPGSFSWNYATKPGIRALKSNGEDVRLLAKDASGNILGATLVHVIPRP